MTSSAVPAERRADPEWSQGDRFRKVRTDAGYTQRDFADLLGVKAPTYAAWEADRTSCPRITTVAKRVEVLTGVRAAWVLGVNEPLPPLDGGPVVNGGSTTHRYSARKRHLVAVDALLGASHAASKVA